MRYQLLCYTPSSDPYWNIIGEYTNLADAEEWKTDLEKWWATPVLKQTRFLEIEKIA